MALFRPLLGAKIEDEAKLRFPLIASFKIDGIRAIWWGAEFMSRTLKTLPNRDLQRRAARLLRGLPRWDGEIVLGEPHGPGVYNGTVRAVMSEGGTLASAMRFYVFDNADAPGGFLARNATVARVEDFVFKLPQVALHNLGEMREMEAAALEQGYEGLILRHPDGPYKQGRSTFREHTMLKLKRFQDAEAPVIAFEELMHNANEATLSETGYLQRSSHADGKVPGGILGALVVDWQGAPLRIGTGFTHAERDRIWRERGNLVGQLAKFKYLPIGMKDLPRHPVFLGWRLKEDL